MSEEQQGPEQFAHDTERKLRDRIEQLERELVVAIEVVDESGRKRGEAEAKLDKAMEALRWVASRGESWQTNHANAALAKLEVKDE